MEETPEPYLPENSPTEPDPAPSRRRLLPYGVAAGALAIAAVGYLAGSTTAGAGATPQNAAAANVVNAYVAAATAPPVATTTCETNHRGVTGTLKAVNGTTLTITKADGGTATVTTSASTTIRRTVAGSAADIKDGQVVAVQGTSSGQSAISAQQIALLPAGAAPNLGGLAPGLGRIDKRASQFGFAVGTVAKAANGSFTVNEPGGAAVAVSTSSATKVVKTVDSSVKDLVVGQPTVAIGTVNSDGSVSATQVNQGTADLGFGKGFGFGFFRGFGGFGKFRGAPAPGGVPATPAAPAAPASIS
jgi:hypothetical protein